MARHWVAKGVLFAVLGVGLIGLCGFVLMSLWNGLMPELFGLRTLGFWQALGLLLLSKILFGGWHGGGGGRRHWRRRMYERWERMTPEERERFREGMRGRCGHGPHAGTETPA